MSGELTVRDHIKNILQKMDLHTRNEVVAFLINHADKGYKFRCILTSWETHAKRPSVQRN